MHEDNWWQWREHTPEDQRAYDRQVVREYAIACFWVVAIVIMLGLFFQAVRG